MRPRSVAVRLPNACLPGANWADCYELLFLGERLTAHEAARRALGSAPRWISSLLALRNRLVAPLGLKAAAPAGDASLIGAFPILRESEREAVLGFDDRHLDFRIVVEVRDGPADSQVIGVTTLVRRRNLFGYLYLAAVTPFHKAIVPALLAQLNEPAPPPVSGPA
ncbi:DUF2867 domain-containing protein [Sinorhizobium fredii]|uniref:DUF2867 domain-containing protein n=2 Tax=Rhizobium fredii TaxID=380 RepID=A0A2A6M0F0_RHIFR|nr:DUF2867 domain-containing protein [Sinorhizobium fredii]MCG5475794.1 DUF2867 domain-containing protein [Sinorhizobium fredii]MQW93803.1 DUF2867 domain-containing protein [Sinorhizobium fredii]MQX10417.1 DUF2867 domain-containing protein [Sinorhizobium fredii]PDT48125.1 DUF2867 domain-containing protein [Sinorhizobium fredii]UTY50832.1 DUF2867 domain-containing protein [Sinorhizobium fredii]